MEGHSCNFWNDIADQIQCSARALTQEETAARASKIHRKSSKNRSKIGLGSAPGASWGHLPPKTAPRAQKTSKTAFADPPQDPSWVPKSMQNRPRSLPNAILFCIFFRIAFEHLRGPIFIASGVRKWSKNRPKIDVGAILQKMHNL